MIHALVGVLPQFLFLGLMLAIAYVPLGDWMARFTSLKRTGL